MIESVPYKHEHIVPLLYQPINDGVRKFFLSAAGKQVEATDSISIIVDGIVMCCGGILEMWTGRGHIWCVFNQESKRNFIPVYRAIKAFLKQREKKYPRIEMSIPIGFDFAKRRAEMLGFKCEIEYAAKYLNDGTACSVYVLLS
jgi:hypothetical protein